MPYLDFGEELPRSGSKFTRLKESGDKLQFRIIGRVFVEGNHFFLTDGKWDIIPCVRINEQAECEYCARFFEAMRSIPKTEDKDEYRKLRDEVKKTVPGCEPGISYNFPVINRETGEFTVFQATPGIRNKIEAEHTLGTKVMTVDFIAKNTGKKGKDRYLLTRVDSADTKELTAEEVKLVEDYENGKFGEMSSNRLDSSNDEKIEE